MIANARGRWRSGSRKEEEGLVQTWALTCPQPTPTADYQKQKAPLFRIFDPASLAVRLHGNVDPGLWQPTCQEDPSMPWASLEGNVGCRLRREAGR